MTDRSCPVANNRKISYFPSAIGQISRFQSGRFHVFNPADFTFSIGQISLLVDETPHAILCASEAAHGRSGDASLLRQISLLVDETPHAILCASEAAHGRSGDASLLGQISFLLDETPHAILCACEAAHGRSGDASLLGQISFLWYGTKKT
ncbi:MAG: hypothetical protein IKQ82_01265 [Lentisphaeria bacterium]|nr:hypothetical protein [Lentisphaeria bacterium]